MSDFNFVDAFNKGIEASEHAEAARAEINQVIKSLSEQLRGATDGRVQIEVIESADPISNLFNFPSLLLAGGSSDLKKRKSQWIGAKNVKAKDIGYVRLAKWERPHEGYPCTLTFNGRDLRSHDRESLEESLAAMLQDSLVGEHLRELLNRPPAQEIGTGGGAAPEG
jgi:hypothetical protein